VAEVMALYRAYSSREPSPLAPLPIRYVDYARWQRQAFTPEALAASLAHWRDRLDRAPVLQLPTDRPRPPVAGFAGATEPVQLPSELGGAVRALGRKEGATLFMTLLAGLEAVLGRYADQTDFAVGTSVAGRERVELEGLIGFFVNTLALRVDL